MISGGSKVHLSSQYCKTAWDGVHQPGISAKVVSTHIGAACKTNVLPTRPYDNIVLAKGITPSIQWSREGLTTEYLIESLLTECAHIVLDVECDLDTIGNETMSHSGLIGLWRLSH